MIRAALDHRKILFRAFLFSVCALCASTLGVSPPSHAAENAAASGSSPLVIEMRIDGEIDPVIAPFIDSGIDEAARRHASLVLITMDTLGGLSDSMKQIIQHILASPVPVAVYVSPIGARGASAGFYILLSADIAAMAPGTHTGAASPVLSIGGFPVQIADETMRRKIMNDATAFLRSYTEKRGRNPQLAETAVTDAKAFTEKEALDGHMIDIVSNGTDELLASLDGRTITRFDGSRTELRLAHAVRSAYELSARQRFLARIVEPDVFFIMLILGALGLYTEFTHPGMIAPGVIGGICAILALFAMHLLPINFAGLLLIFLAIALFILEAKFTSHGILVAGGIVAMILGALFLIRSPLTPAGVSFGIALSATLPFAVITVFLMRLVLRSRKWKAATGMEELVGLVGVVTSPVVAASGGAAHEGMARIHSELWRVVSTAQLARGQQVRVIHIKNLTLHVEPAQSEHNAVR
jgi:membrane-bound serine protease (ClpP class)